MYRGFFLAKTQVALNREGSFFLQTPFVKMPTRSSERVTPNTHPWFGLTHDTYLDPGTTSEGKSDAYDDSNTVTSLRHWEIILLPLVSEFRRKESHSI